MYKYTTTEKVAEYLGRDLTSKEKASLAGLIDLVSRAISTYTGRKWNDAGAIDPTATALYFDGNGQRELFIDDFTDLTSVEFVDSTGDVYQTLTADTEFMLTPLNNTVKESIILSQYIFPNRPKSVKVTAIFTSGTLPDSVIFLATRLVSAQLEQVGETNKYKKESIEGYSRELADVNLEDEMAKSLVQLDPYRKIII